MARDGSDVVPRSLERFGSTVHDQGSRFAGSATSSSLGTMKALMGPMSGIPEGIAFTDVYQMNMDQFRMFIADAAYGIQALGMAGSAIANVYQMADMSQAEENEAVGGMFANAGTTSLKSYELAAQVQTEGLIREANERRAAHEAQVVAVGRIIGPLGAIDTSKAEVLGTAGQLAAAEQVRALVAAQAATQGTLSGTNLSAQPVLGTVQQQATAAATARDLGAIKTSAQPVLGTAGGLAATQAVADAKAATSGTFNGVSPPPPPASPAQSAQHQPRTPEQILALHEEEYGAYETWRPVKPEPEQTPQPVTNPRLLAQQPWMA